MRSEFLGKLCPVCRTSFRQNDDVVVCPVCGTPHHRACYLKENKCGVESYHSSGFVWEGYLPDEPRITEAPPDTGSIRDIMNSEVGENIDELSNQLPETDPAFVEFFKDLYDPTIGEDGVSMKELITFTSTSLFHYQQAFLAFRGRNGVKRRKTFFNIGSGLLAPIFQFYRKMDFLGIILTIVMLLPSFLIALNESFFINNSGAHYIFNFLNIAEQVLLCIFGDYIYYLFAVKKIRKIRGEFKENANSDEYYAALAAAGKPSIPRAIVGTLVFVLLMCLILAIPVIK